MWTSFVVAIAACGGSASSASNNDAGSDGVAAGEDGGDAVSPIRDAPGLDADASADATIFADAADGDAAHGADATDGAKESIDAPQDGPADVVVAIDGPSAGCPTGLPGPPLVRVGASTGVGGYSCIDATEVTNAQYAQFLAANYPISAQDPWCAWNTTYQPPGGWPATGKDDVPVVYVWWCDAFAYCKWAGKRLCGKLGGGPNGYGASADATASQWFNGCSASGARLYPYGNTFSAAACNGYLGADAGLGAPQAVSARTTCQGGQAGVFDMSGNVAEWEDSCNGQAGVSDSCHIRGGSFMSDAQGLRCDAVDSDTRDSATDYIGFRCCGP
jgi:hypothetical protein